MPLYVVGMAAGVSGDDIVACVCGADIVSMWVVVSYVRFWLDTVCCENLRRVSLIKQIMTGLW